MPRDKVIVTGATGSMGSAAVRALADKGVSVILACRNLERGEALKESVLGVCPSADLEVMRLELDSLDSVRAFASSVSSAGVTGLFNNAGTLNRDYTLSRDGYEQCVAVNCLAPMLLCHLLAPAMPEGGHIVNMVSLTCRFASIDKDFFAKGPGNYSQLGTYAMSKLGLMLLSLEFAARHPELNVNVSDPGVVNSNMISMGRWFDPLADVLFRPFCKSPERGVAPALRALEARCSGKLFISDKVRDIPDRYKSDSMIPWLWDRTGELLEWD